MESRDRRQASLPLSHSTPFHCDTARQHPKAQGEEVRRTEKLSHGESGSRDRLPPGPRHGRHRRRARDPRGEGSEPGESSFSGSFLSACLYLWLAGSPGCGCRGGIFGSCSSSAGSRCVGPTSSASRRPRCWRRRTPSPTPPAAARAPAPATSSAVRHPTARWRPSPSSSHGTRHSSKCKSCSGNKNLGLLW